MNVASFSMSPNMYYSIDSFINVTNIPIVPQPQGEASHLLLIAFGTEFKHDDDILMSRMRQQDP